MTRRWRLERGATVLDDRGVRFAVWAPNARRVGVRVVDGPGQGEYDLNALEGGVFEAAIEAAGPGSDYLYVLDEGNARPDPVSRHQPHGVHGPSRVVDPVAFVWRDGSWPGRELADLVLYELHVGTFSEAGTFDGVIPRLPYLEQLGVTALELMPVGEFPGARNWGYDGVALYAPQSTYGGPDGLKRLVDAAHELGLAVILDVVYNHLGPEGNYLGEFGPYFTDRYLTPWGQALNFDGPASDEVRRYVLDNARYWVTEYHVDGLRLDAVHAIFDFGARHLLEDLAAGVHAVGDDLERRVAVIAESDLNDPRLVRPAERGGFQLDAQWSDDFHHAVHCALTGEQRGYYADFGGAEPVVKAYCDRFVLDGRYSSYRRRRHGAPARDLPAHRFVAFIQNHDQIGNRAAGDRLATLVGFDATKLAAALLLLSPYVPLLFMGEEYGERSPFLYFVSHGDAALNVAVREGRRREFTAFGWQGDLPDPGAQETFARSRLTWRLDDSPHAELHRLYRDLLKMRREEPALRPGAASVTVVSDPADGWLTARLDGRHGAALLTAFNLTDATRAVPVGDAGPYPWVLRLSTDDPAYGGAGRVPPRVAADREGAVVQLALPAFGAALYQLVTSPAPEGGAA